MSEYIVMNKMKRVAVDIDEVLVSFVKPMAKFRGYKMPTAQKYPYVYKDMFNITETESRNMVHDFYESEAFAKLRPLPGACTQMGYLRNHADKIYIVTGRQSYARDQTQRWLEYWFPNTFDDLIMTNSYTEFEIEKHEICRSLALDTIIDDNFDICTKCNRIGIDAYNIIGYGDIRYPWAPGTNEEEVEVYKPNLGKLYYSENWWKVKANSRKSIYIQE